MAKLQAPFPYFGGKALIADRVWQALGQPKHYLEPFFGSGAVLLARPDYDPYKHVETVCDKDGLVCNAWRAIKYKPDETAEYCDYPVNHIDIAARRLYIMRNQDEMLENLINDPEWCDPKIAGYWIWGISCSIGNNFVRKKMPTKHNLGPIPGISQPRGVNKFSIRGRINEWLNKLSIRLRYVQIVCGDWKCICRGNWQDMHGIAGIFIDPPYGAKDHDKTVYHINSNDVANEVMEWCIERGKKETYRIVVAGYEEYEELLKHNWTFINWMSQGGYGNLRKKGKTQIKKEKGYISHRIA